MQCLVWLGMSVMILFSYRPGSWLHSPSGAQNIAPTRDTGQEAALMRSGQVLAHLLVA
jgi:hypothetical protein